MPTQSNKIMYEILHRHEKSNSTKKKVRLVCGKEKRANHRQFITIGLKLLNIANYDLLIILLSFVIVVVVVSLLHCLSFHRSKASSDPQYPISSAINLS